ncbi:[citrate (pro-3S)-lyase] ligase [Amphibacillus jilinensis]|uniref:[citrate (pro-3S)-lyase] ligase n=1 Tax=Amphibacillus jilinensis TaxID=1216008 RepID=UPI0002F70F13|nr:[citrate (pro-3S)-lyase] ligase [Amphibacillus jilinensis]
MEQLAVVRLNLARKEVYEVWKAFLVNHGMQSDEIVTDTLGIYDGEKLVATGSYHKNIIKCVAVDKGYRGQCLLNKIVNEIIAELSQKNIYHYFVYTKPDVIGKFIDFGFKKVVCTDHLCLLERGVYGIEYYKHKLKMRYQEGHVIGSIVMNANPFTKGHLHLVKYAASLCDFVHIFVVEEEESVFPFSIRYELVKQGIASFNNVKLHSTGNYIVSNTTFPSYFINKKADITTEHARLDASIFEHYIASALGIKYRFVGEEPFSPTTKIYNRVLKEVLYPTVQLVEIPRLTARNDDIISATKVRALIEANDLESLENYVPRTTLKYLEAYKKQKMEVNQFGNN